MAQNDNENWAETIAAWRAVYVDVPERLKYVDAAVAGLIVFREMAGPDRAIDSDGLRKLGMATAPGIAMINDFEGIGPAGWIAAEALRGFAELAIIIDGNASADGTIEAAHKFGNLLVVETTKEAMRLWSHYLSEGVAVAVVSDGDTRLIVGKIN